MNYNLRFAINISLKAEFYTFLNVPFSHVYGFHISPHTWFPSQNKMIIRKYGKPLHIPNSGK